MSMLKKISFTTDYNWATGLAGGGGAAQWTDVTDFLADGVEPGVEEAQTYQAGDGTTDQDGVILKGEFKGLGANLPAAGTRTWLKFTPQTGSAFVVGGVDGCRCVLSKTSLRPVGGGPAYTLVQFSAAGASAGSTVKSLA